MSSHDPVQIGPFRILAGLGHGGMGRVLLGAGPDGRLVAVKLVRDDLAGDEHFRTRFAREVAASQRVSDPYTAPVLAAGPDDPVPWLATGFLPGPTLRDAVETAGALPEPAVLRLAGGLASALTAIHTAGLIHRDLKPSNVILAADGPRVIDFGIARATENSGTDLTRTGDVIGTPGFMSPEQALSKPLTAATDIFSLGSVLVMACTGTGPFAAASRLETLNNVVRAEPDLADLPERIRTIAKPCLAAVPDARPTPAEVLTLVGDITPTPQPWPDAVAALAERQRRDLTRLLGITRPHTTLIDAGPTTATHPAQPTKTPTGTPAPVKPTTPDRPKGPFATTRRTILWASPRNVETSP